MKVRCGASPGRLPSCKLLALPCKHHGTGWHKKQWQVWEKLTDTLEESKLGY